MVPPLYSATVKFPARNSKKFGIFAAKIPYVVCFGRFPTQINARNTVSIPSLYGPPLVLATPVARKLQLGGKSCCVRFDRPIGTNKCYIPIFPRASPKAQPVWSPHSLWSPSLEGGTIERDDCMYDHATCMAFAILSSLLNLIRCIFLTFTDV
jgi:hypothetical protein